MADTNLDITVTSKGIKEAQAALKKLETEAANAEKASKKLADAAKKLEDKFKLEAAAIGKTADQVKILKLEQSGATKAQIEAAKSALSYKEKTLQAAKAADQAAKEQQQLAASLLKSQAAAEKLRKVNLKASLLAEAKAADKLEKEQLQLAAATNKTAVAAQNLAVKQQGTHKATKELRGGFRAMRGSTQQVSYQLQDIAVQAQMGTSAFIILGQQGPQLASVFGPGGAVLGALIAFGAMLGGVLVTAFKDSETGSDALESALGRLETQIDQTDNATFQLSKRILEFAAVSEAAAQAELISGLKDTQLALRETKDQFGQLVSDSVSQDIQGVALELNKLRQQDPLVDSKLIKDTQTYADELGNVNVTLDELSHSFGISKKQALAYFDAASSLDESSIQSYSALRTVIDQIQVSTRNLNPEFAVLRRNLIKEEVALRSLTDQAGVLRKAKRIKRTRHRGVKRPS